MFIFGFLLVVSLCACRVFTRSPTPTLTVCVIVLACRRLASPAAVQEAVTVAYRSLIHMTKDPSASEFVSSVQFICRAANGRGHCGNGRMK